MLETHTREIAGHTYRVQLLPVGQATKTLVVLIKALSPVLREIVLAGGLKIDGSKVSVVDTKALMGSLLGVLPQAVEGNTLDTLYNAFAASTVVLLPDDRELPLSSQQMIGHFSGRPGAMFRWLAFCAEVNYADFFDVLPPGILAPSVQGPVKDPA